MPRMKRVRDAEWTTARPARSRSWRSRSPGAASRRRWSWCSSALFLGGAVLAAVHHAEVVAHRVGEPFGSLVLAVAVTVIEVALIVTLMVSGGGETATLARDTVFAAVMITTNGIVGLTLLIGALRRGVADVQRGGHGRRAGDRDDADHAQPRPAHVHHEPARTGVLAGAARRSPPSRRSRSTRCSSSSRPSAIATTSCPSRSPDDRRADEVHAEPPSDRATLLQPRAPARRARRRRGPGQDRVAGDRGRRSRPPGSRTRSSAW